MTGEGSALRLKSRMVGAAAILHLFANGENGFLFYPMLAAYLFQDTGATTPVTTDNDPVGRDNDQSGNGNNSIQATAANRPLWKTNSGKPYLQFDGVNDILVSPFLPGAAVTLAMAFNNATTGGILMGGGSTPNNRAYLQIDGSGRLGGGFGSQAVGTIFGGSSTLNVNHVGILTANASAVTVYVDGSQVYTGASAGSPVGGTGTIGIGGFNNSNVPASWSNTRVFSVLGLNRVVTAAEVSLITTQFTSTYQ